MEFHLVRNLTNLIFITFLSFIIKRSSFIPMVLYLNHKTIFFTFFIRLESHKLVFAYPRKLFRCFNNIVFSINKHYDDFSFCESTPTLLKTLDKESTVFLLLRTNWPFVTKCTVIPKNFGIEMAKCKFRTLV